MGDCGKDGAKRMKIQNAIDVRQGRYTMYIFKLSTEELLSGYAISGYDSEKETGYQRPPVEAHYKKIARYLADNEAGQILPMSIIAAATKEDVDYKNHVLTVSGRLRIVDGQHRIKAIEYLRDTKETKYQEKYRELIAGYEFPVILLVSDEIDSALEIDTFININSKGKRININLAKELREKKMQTELGKHQVLLTAESYENLATQTVKLLAHNESSMWYDRIQMGDELGFQKLVSIGTFSKSLKKITGRVADLVVHGDRFISEKEASETAILTGKAVDQIWQTVQERWPECFYEAKKYNLLRGFGVSIMHRLFERCMEEVQSEKLQSEKLQSDGPQEMLRAAQEIFAGYLHKTGIEAEEWLTGGMFTGFSSDQGYGIIVDVLQGKREPGEIGKPEGRL